MGYVTVTEETETKLSFSREPNIWSWSILIGMISLGIGAAYYGCDCLALQIVFVIGAGFTGFSFMEDYEECELDKESKEIRFRKISLLEKIIPKLDGSQYIVSNLEDVTGVKVEENVVKYFGNCYRVVLLNNTGINLGITDVSTYGDESDHLAIAKKIERFLDLQNEKQPYDYLIRDDTSSEDDFEQIDPDDIDLEGGPS